jgi:intein-encoded DNA endonuclease-like protein
MKQDVIILKLQDILKLKKDTMSVSALRKLLGLERQIHIGLFIKGILNRYRLTVDIT